MDLPKIKGGKWTYQPLTETDWEHYSLEGLEDDFGMIVRKDGVWSACTAHKRDRTGFQTAAEAANALAEMLG